MANSSFPQSKNYEKNIERFGEGSDTCIVCGKRTNSKKYVHLLTNGNITDEADENKVQNSQGFFTIGSDCSKLIMPQFIHK